MRIQQTGTIPLDPEKSAAWGEKWRTEHAQRHRAFVSPHSKTNDTTEINVYSPSVRVVLELERQINGGKQISQLPDIQRLSLVKETDTP